LRSFATSRCSSSSPSRAALILVGQLAQTRVIVWPYDIIVPFKLREIERLLDHLSILIETSSILLEVTQIGALDKLTATFSLRIDVL